MEIWSAIGARFPSSTMGHLFGSAGGVGGAADVSIEDALANTRSDGAAAAQAAAFKKANEGKA